MNAALHSTMTPIIAVSTRGRRSASSISGYTSSTSAAAITKDTPTSSGVWTPRYMRLKQMTSVSAMHTPRSHRRLVYRAMPP